MKQPTLSRSDEERREIAYHEAGHAAMHWMFGDFDAIHHIDMRGGFGFHAAVVSQKLNIKKLSSWYPRTLLQFQAKQQIMGLLAGHAAENLLGGGDVESWISCRMQEREELSEDHDPFLWDKGTDLYHAFEIAKVVHGDNGLAVRMIRRVATWTDEALSHPRMWAVVEALAAQLMNIKTRMSGRRAERIMLRAWGVLYEGIPFLTMGRKWKRRFTINLKDTEKD